MAKFCDDCQVWYIVGRENKPKKFCNICRAGMHDCIDEPNDGIRKGNMWFCSECHKQFTKQIKPQMMKKYRNVIFEGFRNDKTRAEDTIIENKIKEIRKDTENEVEVMEVEGTKDDEVEGQNKQKTEKKENYNKKEHERKECYFWLNYQCKFGEKCRKEHPTRCQEILEKGTCRNGNNCKLAHPKICWNLYKHQHCAKKHCWYIHPSKITNKFVFGNKNNFKTNQPGRTHSQWNPGNGYQQGPNSNQSNNNNGNGQNNNGNQQGGWERNWNPGYDNPMYGHQTPNMAPFLGWGPTPSEAYKGGKGPTKMKIMRMFQEIQGMMM